MTPRWVTIERLVASLDGVRQRRGTMAGAWAERQLAEQVDAAVDQAVARVAALLHDRVPEDDETVRAAWTAIATAQDCIARLHETMGRSRALRARATSLQSESARQQGPAARARGSDARPAPAGKTPA